MHSSTVLIVDDDDLNLAILQEMLGERYPLATARNGREAVAAVEKHQPGLVLMDIMMPEMDGYEACRRIKASPLGPVTHVVLVSAKASTAERVRGYEAGADDYIVKPFDEDELLAKTKVQLRLRDALFELSQARTAIAAHNRQLQHDVQAKTRELMDARDLVVFALAKLAESRDPETGDHLERIRSYCDIIARHLSRHGPYTGIVDDAFIEALFLASPLHDIGKVGIPDVILLKPGRLTDREFDMMKHHTSIGAQALHDVAQHGLGGGFLQMAIDVARSHHERWDGSGYPDGLVGEAIPLAARITAVADVFDALSSVRVYKAAFTIEVSRTMIEKDSGTHFDPAIVDAFLACFDQCAMARQRHRTEQAIAEQAA